MVFSDKTVWYQYTIFIFRIDSDSTVRCIKEPLANIETLTNPTEKVVSICNQTVPVAEGNCWLGLMVILSKIFLNF